MLVCDWKHQNQVHIRYMEEHILVTLSVGRSFEIAGTTAFDLHTASSLLLDVFDICSAMANYLSTKIEPVDWL